MSQDEAAPTFQPGENMLLVDGRDRQFLITVPDEGEKARIKGETFDSETLTAVHEGGLVTDSVKRKYLVFRPTLDEIVMNMPRSAQVIFSKDLASLLTYGDIKPGLKVTEVGCGHGALTMALLRALGTEGRLTTYDVRQDHLNRTRKNITTFLGKETLESWTPVMADPGAEGFSALEQERLFTDVPEPWEMLDSAALALNPGAVWAAFVPSVGQMSRLMEAFKAHRHFCLGRCFETMQRYWHVKDPSVRPNHAMRGHTGFIVTCRKRWVDDPVE